MVGVSVGGIMMIGCVGVEVGVDVGVEVGVSVGTVGIGRLMLSLTRLSTSVLSPINVRRTVTVPFGTPAKFQE